MFTMKIGSDCLVDSYTVKTYTCFKWVEITKQIRVDGGMSGMVFCLFVTFYLNSWLIVGLGWWFWDSKGALK